MVLIEQHTSITDFTLTKIATGEAGVSLGIYAEMMFVLELINNRYNLVNLGNDNIGKMYDSENFLKRVRYKEEKKGVNGS